MKENSYIYDIVDLSDCQKIDNSVKYVTIDIKNVNMEVVSYLVNHGKNLLYADRIDDRRGYVYVDYATFVKGQKIVDIIINEMSNNYSEIELARYLYIRLGQIVGYDIDNNRNSYLFNNNCINNIWNCLVSGKISNYTLVKLYMYLCSIVGIDCDIINNGDVLVNRLYINNSSYIVNLYKDLWLIQAEFVTKYFASFNNDVDIDKKIGYIKREYNDMYIDRVLSSIDFMDEDMVGDILIKTQKILDVSLIKPVELGIIYRYIFDKYCSNYNIVINNLFINNEKHEHFIMISYGDKHYSYNYGKKSFMLVDRNIIVDNLNSNKISLFENEIIPNLGRKTITL